MSKLDDMIAEENRLAGATRMLLLIVDKGDFTDDEKQHIRLVGLSLLSDISNFGLSNVERSKNA